ncbi:hypothetical protein F3Y22_tig00110076pilonHSYRG00039 [Hibiscus syriacus]|uniref:Amino acid transporter transmembrane domain-containing protein n=1 Tax=Hibiscus syriacus TaxID=106335 RepID=A0A6A3BL16_HIBSY|nr:hypothetical protein F3Y22_tig00110076pilonHSYRG00039 [Hibiscus syriacus]
MVKSSSWKVMTMRTTLRVATPGTAAAAETAIMMATEAGKALPPLSLHSNGRRVSTNVMVGVGFLSKPNTMAEGGWASLLVLVLLPVVCCYTTILMTYCFEGRQGITSYPDMGWQY